MNTTTRPHPTPGLARRTFLPVAALALLGGAMAVLVALGCGDKHKEQAANPPSINTPGFGTPIEAVDALTSAVRANDTPKLLAIMGPGGQDIISSGDDVADQQRAKKFLALYDQKHVLTNNGPDARVLVIGNDDWPFPIPLVKQNNTWHFDSEAGREEILNRRIGQNELSVIQVCKAIADAQREFALRDPDGDGLEVYAKKFISDPGKRNGLYFPTDEGEPLSPLGELAADAAAEGYRPNDAGPTPYHGYFYRMLYSQGPKAPDGPVDYLVNGKLALGFAVVAWPAEYGNSGIMTFIMGPDGVVYQQNLGDDTPKLAAEIKSFDPGEGWTKVE